MKKIIFGLLATIMFVCTGGAQSNYFKSGMVMLVSQAKTTFHNEPYKDWVAKQSGFSAVLTAEEEKLLKDIYGFLATKAAPIDIYKTYDGASLTELRKMYEKGTLTVTATSSQKWNWLHWLLEAIIIPYLEFTGEIP